MRLFWGLGVALLILSCNPFKSNNGGDNPPEISVNPAPDFSFQDQNGMTHTRDGYLGKVVLINFVGHT